MLDAMALHKLNTFHWHLTDDQGWRIEIKQVSEADRGRRLPHSRRRWRSWMPPGKPKPYCGYYTQEQIRDVVRYAAERHITIVPEIDVPGHATAAIAAYPELGVLDTPPVVSNEWGVNTNLFNAEESTFVFLENVLARSGRRCSRAPTSTSAATRRSRTSGRRRRACRRGCANWASRTKPACRAT